MSNSLAVQQAPHHRLFVRQQVGTLHLDITASFHAPWTLLFGPSGSGKSTLLRLIAGVLPWSARKAAPEAVLHLHRNEASAHRDEPNGQDVVLAEGARALAPERRAIAYAPQTTSLFPHLTAEQNVRFAQTLTGKRTHAADAGLVEQARDMFELQAVWQRHPARLSGGEAQRVNLARAFARPGARLLLLDEPFTGLDRALRARILARLCPALRERGLPVISVTHDIEEAFLLGAEVLRLEAGRVIARGSAAEVLASERRSLLSALRP